MLCRRTTYEAWKVCLAMWEVLVMEACRIAVSTHVFNTYNPTKAGKILGISSLCVEVRVSHPLRQYYKTGISVTESTRYEMPVFHFLHMCSTHVRFGEQTLALIVVRSMGHQRQRALSPTAFLWQKRGLCFQVDGRSRTSRICPRT